MTRAPPPSARGLFARGRTLRRAQICRVGCPPQFEFVLGRDGAVGLHVLVDAPHAKLGPLELGIENAETDRLGSDCCASVTSVFSASAAIRAASPGFDQINR